MTLASSDFRGIVAINKELVDTLHDFFTEKEALTVLSVQDALSAPLAKLGACSFSADTLTELIAILRRHLSEACIVELAEYPQEQKAEMQTQISSALWSYLEVLEGGATELFEQLDQTGLEQWDYPFSKVLESLVGIVQERLDSVLSNIIALEELLWTLFSKLKPNRKRHLRWIEGLRRLTRFLLDRELISTAKKSQRFLLVRYRGWLDRYTQYIKFNSRASESLNKFSHYSNLQKQPQNAQDNFQFIYRLLKIWEMDAKAKAILLEDLMRAIRRRISGDSALQMYQEYYLSLQDTLFSASRAIKKQDLAELQAGGVAKKVISARKELLTLGRAISRYRAFLLRTDPNPYVRSRWGFAEWVVGPEPENCRQLLQLELKVEGLDLVFDQFIQSLHARTGAQRGDEQAALYAELEKILHGMSQPLSSRHAIINQAERFVDVLKKFNEIGSASPDAIEKVTEVMGRALSADWKYHVLHENQQFVDLYHVHHELMKEDLGQSEFSELMKWLKQQTSRIVKWTKKGTTEKHQVELDRFEARVQGYLDQMFVDHKISKEEKQALRSQLLALRYAMGEFYNRLYKVSSEAGQVKARFHHIDQTLDGLDMRFSPYTNPCK